MIHEYWEASGEEKSLMIRKLKINLQLFIAEKEASNFQAPLGRTWSGNCGS